LLGQALAAAILVIGGIQVQLFTNNTFNIALTMIWVVGITNAMNLLDNMDGLSSGVATVCGAFFVAGCPKWAGFGECLGGWVNGLHWIFALQPQSRHDFYG
jgi:UDP-N-acetylmuramyl pentapeptide phosphotransferase/UDP-N-acetylglucosamine-1-phosphate transferase